MIIFSATSLAATSPVLSTSFPALEGWMGVSVIRYLFDSCLEGQRSLRMFARRGCWSRCTRLLRKARRLELFILTYLDDPLLGNVQIWVFIHELRPSTKPGRILKALQVQKVALLAAPSPASSNRDPPLIHLAFQDLPKAALTWRNHTLTKRDPGVFSKDLSCTASIPLKFDPEGS